MSGFLMNSILNFFVLFFGIKLFLNGKVMIEFFINEDNSW